MMIENKGYLHTIFMMILNCLKRCGHLDFESVGSAHWNKNKMAANLQTTYSNMFWLKNNVSCFKYQWSLIQRSRMFVPKPLIDNKSILVKVMTWHRMAISHYLSQWLYGPLAYICITRPQWVNHTHPRALSQVITQMLWLNLIKTIST